MGAAAASGGDGAGAAAASGGDSAGAAAASRADGAGATAVSGGDGAGAPALRADDARADGGAADGGACDNGLVGDEAEGEADGAGDGATAHALSSANRELPRVGGPGGCRGSRGLTTFAFPMGLTKLRALRKCWFCSIVCCRRISYADNPVVVGVRSTAPGGVEAADEATDARIESEIERASNSTADSCVDGGPTVSEPAGDASHAASHTPRTQRGALPHAAARHTDMGRSGRACPPVVMTSVWAPISSATDDSCVDGGPAVSNPAGDVNHAASHAPRTQRGALPHAAARHTDMAQGGRACPPVVMTSVWAPISSATDGSCVHGGPSVSRPVGNASYAASHAASHAPRTQRGALPHTAARQKNMRRGGRACPPVVIPSVGFAPPSNSSSLLSSLASWR